MLVLSLISLVVLTVLMPFLTGMVPVSLIPQLMADQVRHFIRGSTNEEVIIPLIPELPQETPLITEQQQTPLNLDPIDLLHDFETLVQQNKDQAKKQVIDMYNQYIPTSVSGYVNSTFSQWQSHSSYKTYQDHESVINNTLLMIGLFLVCKLIISGRSFIFGSSSETSNREGGFHNELGNNKNLIFDNNGVINKQYTEFETIPLCEGKAEIEENLIMKSYEKMKVLKELGKTTSESASSGFPGSIGSIGSNGLEQSYVNGNDLSILGGSTPRQSTPSDESFPISSNEPSELASPLLVRSQMINRNYNNKILEHPKPQEPIKTFLTQQSSPASSLSLSSPSPSSTEPSPSPSIPNGTPQPRPSNDSRASSSSSKSVSPEDSFEREERVLDKSLSKLNESPSIISRSNSERPYTPSRLSINSSMDYSPSKKLIYKTSTSILTSRQVTMAETMAETTVGSITEEVVYSEISKGDADSSSTSEILTPLRMKM